MLDKAIQWSKLHSSVIFLVNPTTNEAVYFNIVDTFQSTTASRQSFNEQNEKDAPLAMANLPRHITMGGWLCANMLHLTKYLADVVLSVGKYVVEVDPLDRKLKLEEWKASKTKLTLYGIEEKNENVVITSLSETKDNKYHPIYNINVKVGLNEIKNNEKVSTTTTFTDPVENVEG